MNELVNISQELMAISNDALLYCKDRFDAERFREVRKIAARILELSAENITADDALKLFEENEGYQTPKMDTRAAIFNEKDEILLVRDYDGKWALPGGWCEYNSTIMENTVKEAREEAGIEVEPVRSCAAHSNRAQQPEVVFLHHEILRPVRGTNRAKFKANDETTEARYFSVDELPKDINDHKSSPAQIRLCLEALHADDWCPHID